MVVVLVGVVLRTMLDVKGGLVVVVLEETAPELNDSVVRYVLGGIVTEALVEVNVGVFVVELDELLR